MSDSPTFESPNFASDDELDEEELEEEELGEEELDSQEDFGDEEPDDEEEPAVAPANDRGNEVDGGTARAVLEHAARSIVDDPDAVVVDSAPGRSGVLLSLHVAPGDMGRIIGKRGRVAQALRSLVRAAAARDGADATVDIVD